jgi:Sulfotransferase family
MEQSQLPKSMADINAFVQGADAALVTEVLADMPPTFFLVGAPRCGTTSLSRALAGNRHISFSKPKETHFFLDNRSHMTTEAVRRLYLESFHPNLARDSQAIGDGSVSYLYSPGAIEQALAFDRRAKFIASVRNPVDMLRSYHARLLFSLDEDVADFPRAWALQEDRRAGRHIPRRCRDPRLLLYGDVGKLGDQIEQLFAIAGRERCHVVVFDDFVRNPRGVYVQLLEFLGVDDDGRTEFKRKRETAGFKSRWLQQFVMNPPPWAFRLIEISDAKVLSRLKRLHKRIKKFNKVPEDRQDLSDEMRATLRGFFAADVGKLSGLLNRDLQHWTKS